MCGICGMAASRGGPPISHEVLKKMNDIIAHRGPDEDGFFVNDKVGLASRRLSIIDLAGGTQPIPNEDGSMQIVFNGEIYNYRELRNFLEKHGHTFRTQSDTEVILHLFEEFGTDCIQHLDGIFAFAIWNETKQELLIARDRMGIKPMYYTHLPDFQLVFGSEMKSILANPAVERKIDLISLNEYLSYEYVPTPRTIIQNVWRLEAGHYLLYNRRGLEIQAYDKLTFHQSESRPPVDWRDYSTSLYETLSSAVKRELVSDVPVGVLLSGGLDSSAIAALMTELYPGQVESFTIGFEEDSFDESRHARKVAKRLNTAHNEMILTGKKAVELVSEISNFLDEPFADSSIIPTYLLSRFARQKVKVVLGGDGGDELFAGYPTVLSHRLIEYYERSVPWTLRAYVAPRMMDLFKVSFDNISLDFKLKRFLAGRGVPLITRHQRWLGSFVDEEKSSLLQNWMKPVLRETYYQSYEFARECDAKKPLNQILYNDMKTYLEGDILYKVDRASMAASLEVRVPYLNREVVKFANDLPFGLKLHNFTGKFLLKKMIKGRLPDEIINRSKKGFNMPVAHWLTKDLNELMNDMLSKSFVDRQGLFNHTFTDKLISNHLEHKIDNRKLLWTLLMFQLWYQHYIE
ncbi:MAG: asparagine synthase (glutamine-hydrolyzing) [Anaerolineales bacterium]|nr:asparagine synthase (glutamine-hydrolyzing) [Anaerolineales bacterium]